MPYLGNEPATAFTSTTKDTFSGDASTTDFTLSKAGNNNALRVVVENVVQDPGVAYTCSGTTLSFTSAPPTGTNNIYVVHLGPPAATVAPPTTINNTTNFTASLGINNAAPSNDLHILGKDTDTSTGITIQTDDTANAVASLTLMSRASDNTNKTRILKNSGGSIIFEDGSDTFLSIDSDGIINKPKQPAFLAQKNAAQNNIATSTLVTVDFNSEIFDQNSDYNTSTSTFTAPVTGRYLITCHILMEAVDTAADYYQLRLVTSNRIHYSTKDWGGYSSDPAYGVLDVIVITDMDASDTLYAAIYQAGGSAQTDLNTTTCTFSACLLA